MNHPHPDQFNYLILTTDADINDPDKYMELSMIRIVEYVQHLDFRNILIKLVGTYQKEDDRHYVQFLQLVGQYGLHVGGKGYFNPTWPIIGSTGNARSILAELRTYLDQNLSTFSASEEDMQARNKPRSYMERVLNQVNRRASIEYVLNKLGELKPEEKDFYK